MKAPSFFEGVVVALIASIAGEFVFMVLPWFVASKLAGLLLISLLSISYLIYLLRRSPLKTGRVTLLLVWAATSLIAVVLDGGFLVYLFLQLTFIWLSRSLYFHKGLFGALADLGLHGIAAAFGVWAYARSGSLFLALWSFFLVEALFPLLPGSASSNSSRYQDKSTNNPLFEQAHRSALAALQRLSTR